MGDLHRVEITPVITGPDAPVKGELPSQSKPQDKPAVAERPAHVPEKFWKNGQIDHEAWAKSYSELEKKQSTQPKATVEPKAPESKPNAGEPNSQPKPNGEQTPKAGEQNSQPTASIPGVSQEQSQKYWSELNSETAQLSETSYSELEKAGYPKHVVDAYISGIRSQQTSAATEVKAIKDLAGGEEEYSAMSEWMATNLDETEIAEYNEAVTSGKKSVIKLAVQNMHTKYRGAMGGPEPKLLGGNSGNPTVGEVFRSQAEITAAMRDPRYKRDSAYRQEVQEKLGRSKI